MKTTPEKKRTGEHSAQILGWCLAPIAGIGSILRKARFLHPEGLLFSVSVEPLPTHESLQPLAESIQGPALVRLSNGWWKGKQKEWPDVLGIAIRFKTLPSEAAQNNQTQDKQDLLFATIRHPMTTLLAPLSTDQHDFLNNYYQAVSPFSVLGISGDTYFRLRPFQNANANSSTQRSLVPLTRKEKVEIAVRKRVAVFYLEIQNSSLSQRDWQSISKIQLMEELQINQESLQFNPFFNALGIFPRGFVHYLRKGVYFASQLLRPKA